MGIRLKKGFKPSSSTDYQWSSQCRRFMEENLYEPKQLQGHGFTELTRFHKWIIKKNLYNNRFFFSEYISLVMSAMYAVLLVTLGLIFYLGDSFVDFQISLVTMLTTTYRIVSYFFDQFIYLISVKILFQIYSLILCGIGFIYVLFLIIDINKYKSIALKNQRIKGLHEENISEYFRSQEVSAYLIFL